MKKIKPLFYTTVMLISIYVTDINIVTWRSTGWELPDGGLRKPKQTEATIIILNYFNNLTILYELCALRSWVNKELNITNMYGATTKITIAIFWYKVVYNVP